MCIGFRFGRLIHECCGLSLRLNNVSIYFVKQSANCIARYLARASNFISESLTVLGEINNIPPELVVVSAKDLSS